MNGPIEKAQPMVGLDPLDDNGRAAGRYSSTVRLGGEHGERGRREGQQEHIRTRGSHGEPFGVALVDCQGNLLGVGKAGDLAGEVGVPPGVDPRKDDLSSYLGLDLCGAGGRRFPLVSATWVEVTSRRVRVGIYMETGERLVSPERLDLDVGRIAAILSSQGIA